MSKLLEHVLELYPKLDHDIADYLGGLLDDVDCFDSADDVSGGIGPFLIDCAQAKQDDVDTLAEKLWGLMDKKSDEPIKLVKAVVFGDNAVDTSEFDSLLVTDIELRGNYNAKESAKADKRARAKLAKRQAEEEAEKNREKDELLKEQAVASQAKTKSAISMSGDILIENFDLTFGAQQLIQNADLNLAAGKRYGCVGRNGAGKSTLLRALSSRGLSLPTNISVLHVEQEVIGDDTTALDSVLGVLTERTSLLKEAEDLGASGADNDRLLVVHERLEEIDADSKPSEAAGILDGLGFTTKMQKMTTKEFSGGWRMRLALAQALLMEPDLLLLDEPTNMLDMRAVLWLESRLQNWPNTLLTVSHDRSYLNSVCTDIIHLSSRTLYYYKGDYDTFEKTRGERHKQQLRDYEAQKSYRDHIQIFIDRFRYNANRAAQVQSKIKILEKLPVLYPPEPPEVVKFGFNAPAEERINGNLLQMDNVEFRYSSTNRQIFTGIDLSCDSKSRIAIVGENGAGKSTLLKLLLGRLEPTKGYVTHNRNCRIAYFAQHHIEDFDLSLNPIETLRDFKPGKTAEEYRRILGGFGCTGDVATRKMNVLSGGQKSRVAFAKLGFAMPHLLVLDEPTNHLDVETVAALAEALKQFKGGVILVSHDERLISVACNEVWNCADGTVKRIEGGLEAYRSALLADFNKGGISKHKE